MNSTTPLPPPVNHVFVDFENVHEIDLSIIGSRTVSFMLLVGARQTKLDADLVAKLLEHAGSVQLVRLTSSSKNALDFALAYYVGCATTTDPNGSFHIASKDAGYDPLIEHLRSKHIRAYRHDNFSSLTFNGTSKPIGAAPPIVPDEPKPRPKPATQPATLDDLEAQVLEHLRKPTTTRPNTQKKLISYLVAFFGHKLTEDRASALIKYLSQAGHLAIDEKGKVTYYIARG